MSTTAVEAAVSRRREVFAAISSANGRQDAVDAVARLLAVPVDQAEAVLTTPIEAFVGHTTEHPVTDGPHGFALHPFRDDETHTDLYRKRSSDSSSATAGEWDADRTEQERKAGLERIEAETAMWFVAVDTLRGAPVGLVFGEQTTDGDVDVAIWVLPEERKKGFGMHALRECRKELAAFFPGKHVVVRAPLSSSAEK